MFSVFPDFNIRKSFLYLTGPILIALLCFFLIRNINSGDSFSNKIDSLAKRQVSLHPAVIDYLEFIESFLDSTNNVGAGLTIVYKGETQIIKTYGVKKVGTTDSINNQTVFRLASVSKGFAGVLACMLENEQLFTLDDKVIEYLPEFKLKDSVNTHDLTIEHTLSHTSGLVPHAYDNLIEDGVPLSKIMDQLPAVDISAPPGILYGYQNVVFSLIDTIGRTITGFSYPELLSKKIFGPLKMKQASASARVFNRKRSNYAYPHARRDTTYFALPLNKGYYNIAPAAGVNASIEDMNKWLMALLGNNPEIIDSTILKKISTPVIISPLKRKYTRYWDRIDSKYYSLGWRIYMYKGYKIIYHGGYVKGYRAEIAFCPEEEVGLVFLQNSPNRIASMCVPAFFNLWIASKESVEPDSIKYRIVPNLNFLDDSFFNINEKFELIPDSNLREY